MAPTLCLTYWNNSWFGSKSTSFQTTHQFPNYPPISKDNQDHSTISMSSHTVQSCPLLDYERHRGVNSSTFKPNFPILYVPISNLEDHSKPKADSHSSNKITVLPHSNGWALSAWSNSMASRHGAWRKLMNTPAWVSLPGGPASSPQTSQHRGMCSLDLRSPLTPWDHQTILTSLVSTWDSLHLWITFWIAFLTREQREIERFPK